MRYAIAMQRPLHFPLILSRHATLEAALRALPLNPLAYIAERKPDGEYETRREAWARCNTTRTSLLAAISAV